MTATVVVCTFNRSGLLADTLKALRKQQAPAGGFEILVVDNNSTDDTRAVTASFSAKSKPPIRYVFEPRQGLSVARNTGIGSAEGDVVVFIDDDVDIEQGWLPALVGPLSDPGVGCAGGILRPIWPFQKPDWLTKDWESYLGITEFESVRDTLEFRWPTYPWGGNIAFRRDIFTEVGGFPADLGRIGTGLLANEEVSVCQRIEKAGYRILLAPDAIVYHKIHPDRLTKQYFYHRAYYQGRSDAILDRRVGAGYARLEAFASSAFWRSADRADNSFDRKCRDRLFTGYLSQLIGLHDDTESQSEYQKLRALKGAVFPILRTATAALDQKSQYLDRTEALVRERDEWLAERDRHISDLSLDRDSWKQVAQERETQIGRLEALLREREQWLENRDLRAAELTADRDNWQRVAAEREADFVKVEALVRERDRWLAERDAQQAELALDRDNWQRVAAEREADFVKVEALVRERDRWLAERDAQQAELALDRDNWQRVAAEREADFVKVEALVRERDRWLAERDAQWAELTLDRDNWKRRAGEAEQARAVLLEESWVRVGRWLRLADRHPRPK